MSLATLSTSTLTADCLDAVVTLYRRGVGVAHLEVAADLAPLVGAPASVVIAGEVVGTSQTFAGVVRRAEFWQGRARVVIVLGAGGMRDALPVRDHVGGASSVTSMLIAQGIADNAGETIASGVASALSGIAFPRWHRAGADNMGEGGTGADGLDVLVDKITEQTGRPGFAWRTLADGTLWIGEDTYPDEGADTGNVFEDDGDDGAIHCAPPLANLRPGTTINGRRAERVTYRATGAGLRAEVLYTVAGDFAARKRPAVYQQTHAAATVLQNADGTVDLVADDPAVGGVSAVPFKLGIPGCKVTIPNGSRLHLAFADGDPSQPFAFGLDPDAAAAQALALVGDAVVVGTISGANGGGPVQFVFTPPSGPPVGPLSEVTLTGIVTGPGHKYIKGVSGS